MKIWIQITLLMFIVTNVFIQLTFMLVEPAYEKEIINLYGEKVKSIAATAAAHINGDDYRKLKSLNKEDAEKEEVFNELRNQLISAKNFIDLNEEIYTLSRIDDNRAIFDVMTNKNTFAGDTLHLVAQTAKDALKKVYTNQECVYTDIYKDQYGVWVSGVAPIYASDSSVVGVVQADHESSFIYSNIEEVKENILYLRLVTIPLLLLVSIVVSRLITNPINNVTGLIKQIASGDYSAGKNVKTTGELKELVQSTDLMRKTILEQQDKIFESIRELKEKNEELKIAKDKAEQSDKLKSEFLNLISHEIRTPLNVILNYLAIVQEEVEEVKEVDLSEFMDGIKSENFRLTRTIDLIVQMAEFQTDSYVSYFEEFKVEEVVMSVFTEYEKLAFEKGLSIKLEIDDKLPLMKLDKYSTHLIVSNLIDNAVKFTENGEINVSLKKQTDCIELKVIDTGIGIDPDFMPKLYEIFTQEDHGMSRQYDGNGLGMALVKKCSDLNNATVDVISDKTSGTKVSVKFMFDLDQQIA